MSEFQFPRWQCQDLSKTLAGLPAIRALDSCGVAYLALTEDGSRVHMSPPAADLLSLKDRDRFWNHLRRAWVALGPDANLGRPQILPPWGPIALSHSWTITNHTVLRVITFHPAPVGRPKEARIRNCLLTARELEIARLIAEGESTKRIAAALGISCHTARHHTERIFAKLTVRSRAAVASIVSAWIYRPLRSELEIGTSGNAARPRLATA